MRTTAAPIVLVEDDAHDVFFVHRALASARIQNPLQVFASAKQVREHLRAQLEPLGPVLVILDLNLGGGETGLDVLHWIRQQPEPFGSTPALFLTGSDRQTDRDESHRLGAMSYLHKPVTAENLTAAVQALGFVIVTNVTSGELAVRIIQRR